MAATFAECLPWGGPPEPSCQAPHEPALLRSTEMTEAQIGIPTRFNLRRRILVPDEDSTYASVSTAAQDLSRQKVRLIWHGGVRVFAHVSLCRFARQHGCKL